MTHHLPSLYDAAITGSKWESRKNTAVFRGGINDRACYPITELGGDEMGAVDSSFAHKPCGRKRLLQVAKCFPTALDAAPTDHKYNFMTPQDQESYKYGHIAMYYERC